MSQSMQAAISLLTWLQRNEAIIYERAVKDIDESRELLDAVTPHRKGNTTLSPTQLSALFNMARTGRADQIESSIRDRVNRRRAAGKEDEATFWEQLRLKLAALSELCDAAADELQVAPDNKEQRLRIKNAVIQAYLLHVVPHLRYRMKIRKEDL